MTSRYSKACAVTKDGTKIWNKSPPQEIALTTRAGIGVAAQTTNDPRESWRSALIALRVTDDEHPVLHASDLGVLLSLADAAEQKATVHPDVKVLDILVKERGPTSCCVLSPVELANELGPPRQESTIRPWAYDYKNCLNRWDTIPRHRSDVPDLTSRSCSRDWQMSASMPTSSRRRLSALLPAELLPDRLIVRSRRVLWVRW